MGLISFAMLVSDGNDGIGDRVWRDISLGGDENSRGGDENSPGGDENSLGGDENSPGGDENSLGGDENSPGGDENCLGGDENYPGGEENSLGGGHKISLRGGKISLRGGKISLRGGEISLGGGHEISLRGGETRLVDARSVGVRRLGGVAEAWYEYSRDLGLIDRRASICLTIFTHSVIRCRHALSILSPYRWRVAIMRTK